MSQLAPEWNNEAYVSLHLVQKMLQMAGLPPRTSYSHWHPEFKVKVLRQGKNGHISTTEKEVDFLIEDYTRHINFLIEVKAANTKIDDPARIQLETYLKYSKIRFGILIDPFQVEVYEYIKGQSKHLANYQIENPEHIQPVASFLQNFLEAITY